MDLPHDIDPTHLVCRRCGETKVALLVHKVLDGVCKEPLPHVRLCRGFYRMGYCVIQVQGGLNFVPALRSRLSRRRYVIYGDWLAAYIPIHEVARLAAYVLRRELNGSIHASSPLVKHIQMGGLSACGPFADLLEDAGWECPLLLSALRSYY